MANAEFDIALGRSGERHLQIDDALSVGHFFLNTARPVVGLTAYEAINLSQPEGSRIVNAYLDRRYLERVVSDGERSLFQHGFLTRTSMLEPYLAQINARIVRSLCTLTEQTEAYVNSRARQEYRDALRPAHSWMNEAHDYSELYLGLRGLMSLANVHSLHRLVRATS